MYHGGSFQNILFIFQAAMKKGALYPVDGENDPLIEGFPFMGEHLADFSDNGGDPLLRKLPAPGASRKYVGPLFLLYFRHPPDQRLRAAQKIFKGGRLL